MSDITPKNPKPNSPSDEKPIVKFDDGSEQGAIELDLDDILSLNAVIKAPQTDENLPKKVDFGTLKRTNVPAESPRPQPNANAQAVRPKVAPTQAGQAQTPAQKAMQVRPQPKPNPAMQGQGVSALQAQNAQNAPTAKPQGTPPQKAQLQETPLQGQMGARLQTPRPQSLPPTPPKQPVLQAGAERSSIAQNTNTKQGTERRASRPSTPTQHHSGNLQTNPQTDVQVGQAVAKPAPNATLGKKSTPAQEVLDEIGVQFEVDFAGLSRPKTAQKPQSEAKNSPKPTAPTPNNPQSKTTDDVIVFEKTAKAGKSSSERADDKNTPSVPQTPNTQNNTSQKANPAYIKITPKGSESAPKKAKEMQVVLSKKTLTGKQIGAVMAMSLLLITWFKQDRLADYWQQSYQSGQPWTALASVGGWRAGETVGHALSLEGLNTQLSYMGIHSQRWLNQVFLSETLAQEQAKKEAELRLEQERRTALAQAKMGEQTASTPTTTPEVKPNEPLTHIHLKAGQKVLFAGDSMMQGVAPWVMRKLKSEHQIDSMDLSKQSTGLSYSSFFDWPATIEKAFAEHSEIGALVIYLGANDPWAVPNPANKAAKYIDFATDEWVVLYHQKMNRILDNAKAHGVQVIWITPPTMKKQKLNEQMKVLTDIMHKGIDKTQVVVMDSKPLLSPSDDYTDSIVIGEKTVKVRTADGIHFTTDGQKHLANHILDRIKTEP